MRGEQIPHALRKPRLQRMHAQSAVPVRCCKDMHAHHDCEARLCIPNTYICTYVYMPMYTYIIRKRFFNESKLCGNGWMVGWFGPEFCAAFLNVYAADAWGSFNWSAERMDGWPGWLEFLDP